MLQAFYHEVEATVGDEALRLVLNFRALDAVESHTERSFDGILQQMTAADADVPMALAARVFWGLLREHHPEVTIDQAMGAVNGPAAAAIGVAMGQLFEKAFPRAQPATSEAKPAHPRKPRGASKPTSSRGSAKA